MIRWECSKCQVQGLGPVLRKPPKCWFCGSRKNVRLLGG